MHYPKCHADQLLSDHHIHSTFNVSTNGIYDVGLHLHFVTESQNSWDMVCSGRSCRTSRLISHGQFIIQEFHVWSVLNEFCFTSMKRHWISSQVWTVQCTWAVQPHTSSSDMCQFCSVSQRDLNIFHQQNSPCIFR